MPGAARRIERLVLTAPAEDGIARGRMLVEDAFRIASFPGEAERRVLAIRRLELGVVDPDRSSAALAPVIEEAVRAAARRAVCFDDPAAPAADAVYFPDELAAAAAFVERHVRRTMPTEWFWDAVFEGPILRAEPAAGVRIVLDRLLDLPGGAVRVALLMDVLRTRATLDRFLGWLGPSDGARMLRAFGIDAVADRSTDSPEQGWAGRAAAMEPRPEPRREPPLITSPTVRAWYPVLAAWVRRWGEGDPRSRWLAAAALVSTQPSIMAHTELHALTGRVLRAARHPVVGTGPPRRPPSSRRPSDPARRTRRQEATEARAAAPATSSPSSISRAEPGASPMRRTGIVDRPSGDLEIRTSQPTRVERSRVAETEALESRAPPPTPWRFDLHPTDAAGLLFVLPLLSRLGIVELLEKNPILVEMEFPLRFLRFVADRLRVPREDAVRAALEPAAPSGPPVERSVLASWLTRVRRAVRRHAKMGMRALVVRSGRIAATPTHIDIVLPLDKLDVRVRRAGLDADPGWVPWLGKVVSFHYEAEP